MDAGLREDVKESFVRFQREGVLQCAYFRHIPAQASEDTGPGIVETGYWRVRAPVDREEELHVLRKGPARRLLTRLGAQDVSTGDAAFDDAFVVKASDESFVTERLPDEVRALCPRYPTLILRCLRGRVEALWPIGTWSPETVERFADASALVTALVRALEEEGREDDARFVESGGR